jgi:hypothetical protein
MTSADWLAAMVVVGHVNSDPDLLSQPRVDHTGRGRVGMRVRSGSAQEVTAVLNACGDAGQYVTGQGGQTPLVAAPELVSARASALTSDLGALAPVDSDWLLRIGQDDAQTERLTDALEGVLVAASRPELTPPRGDGYGRWAKRSPKVDVAYKSLAKFFLSLPFRCSRRSPTKLTRHGAQTVHGRGVRASEIQREWRPWRELDHAQTSAI